MKKFLITILLVLSVCLVSFGAVEASPYAASGSYVDNIPDYFMVTMDTGDRTKVDVYKVSSGAYFVMDVGSVSVANHRLKIESCRAAYPLWGIPEVCQSPLFFDFTRPAQGSPPANPAGIVLTNTLPQ